MGVQLNNEDQAVAAANEIPPPCREYISHHVRNGLVSILGAAMKLTKEPADLKEMEAYIQHIAKDLKKIGL